ncbi:MAG: Cyclic di-GMP phosphodiesterase [Accumulibacter sp.]|uniref:HD-GYP domain-containing protein n=1 Tax=Accumulibacter sp. TaxID=2053492 RepID=UPI0011FB7F61|nr:HD-GYP domain-containing protein [Accumulibacter sp.]TLD45797.1 MAG: Cyclic di-GMP phosphodiesterase [Accumulibacter sp.]
MSNNSERPVAIHPSQVVVGLYVWLDLPWSEHPFLCNRFKVSNVQQIAAIHASPVQGKLYYLPEKSTAVPLPLTACDVPTGMSGEPDVAAEGLRSEAAPGAGKVSDDPSDDLSGKDWCAEIAREKQRKEDRRRTQQEVAARAERAWESAARVTREAMIQMTHSPKQAGAKLLDLSEDIAKRIAHGQEVVLRLIGDKGDEGPQFHALNVMTLSVLLGRVAGLDEGQLAELALGTLAHDIGKARIPTHILRAKNRTKYEEEFCRRHGAYGVEVAEVSGAFGQSALSIIADHHEYLDGSGWPTGKRNPGLAARIGALVNRYDRLCAPESPERDALMPTAALARLFRVESAKFDQRLLSMLIKLLGVYPPGTIVRLSDESHGLVVAPGKESLRPTILIYNPEFEKQDAPTVNLAEVPELRVEAALPPASVPADILHWLKPRERLSYFFSSDTN